MAGWNVSPGAAAWFRQGKAMGDSKPPQQPHARVSRPTKPSFKSLALQRAVSDKKKLRKRIVLRSLANVVQGSTCRRNNQFPL
eukprot:g64446.t1